MIFPHRPPHAELSQQITLRDIVGDNLPDWPDAECLDNPEFFFPNPRSSAKPQKEACRRCPYQVPCLEQALANRERFGVWGGKTEGERQRMLRARESRVA